MTNYSYTLEQARDELYNTFWSRWNDPTVGWHSVLPGVDPDDPTAPLVVWDGDEPDDDAEITQPTVYVFVRHVTGKQASLRGENGRRWRRTGFILHRLNTPRNDPLKSADRLSKVILDCYQGKRGVGTGAGITFPSVRPTEQGTLKARYRTDIIASFEYDELI